MNRVMYDDYDYYGEVDYEVNRQKELNEYLMAEQQRKLQAASMGTILFKILFTFDFVSFLITLPFYLAAIPAAFVTLVIEYIRKLIVVIEQWAREEEIGILALPILLLMLIYIPLSIIYYVVGYISNLIILPYTYVMSKRFNT